MTAAYIIATAVIAFSLGFAVSAIAIAVFGDYPPVVVSAAMQDDAGNPYNRGRAPKMTAPAQKCAADAVRALYVAANEAPMVSSWSQAYTDAVRALYVAANEAPMVSSWSQAYTDAVRALYVAANEAPMVSSWSQAYTDAVRALYVAANEQSAADGGTPK